MRYSTIFIFIFIFLFPNLGASQKRRSFKVKQAFSFFQEVAFLKTQIDGDNLRGYSKPGFKIVSGVNYRLTEFNYLRVGIDYAHLGSKRSSVNIGPPKNNVEVELGLKIMAVDFGWVLRTRSNSAYFRGSLLFNNVIDYNENLHFPLMSNESEIDELKLKRQFFAFESACGFNLVNNISVWLALNFSITSLLEESFQDIEVLKPYHLGIGLAYYLVP